jgi:hypothetical protein
VLYGELAHEASRLLDVRFRKAYSTEGVTVLVLCGCRHTIYEGGAVRCVALDRREAWWDGRNAHGRWQRGRRKCETEKVDSAAMCARERVRERARPALR